MVKLDNETADSLRNARLLTPAQAPSIKRLTLAFQAKKGRTVITVPASKDEKTLVVATLQGVDFTAEDADPEVAAAKAVAAACEEMLPNQLELVPTQEEDDAEE